MDDDLGEDGLGHLLTVGESVGQVAGRFDAVFLEVVQDVPKKAE